MNLFKSTALVAALAVGLSACNPQATTTLITNDLAAVGKAFDTGWQVLSGDAAPAACAVASSVANYGSLVLAAGMLVGFNNNVANQAIKATAAVANGSLCQTLLSGGKISDPFALVAQIVKTVADVEAATGGKVNAIVATAPTTSSGKLGASHGIMSKQALFNDKLRFKLYGLKSSRYHY